MASEHPDFLPGLPLAELDGCGPHSREETLIVPYRRQQTLLGKTLHISALLSLHGRGETCVGRREFIVFISFDTQSSRQQGDLAAQS